MDAADENLAAHRARHPVADAEGRGGVVAQQAEAVNGMVSGHRPGSDGVRDQPRPRVSARGRRQRNSLADRFFVDDSQGRG
jgi:hypothetical protein